MQANGDDFAVSILSCSNWHYACYYSQGLASDNSSLSPSRKATKDYKKELEE